MAPDVAGGPARGRIPYNLEAETACLGSVLIKNTLLDDIFSVIKPEDFFDGRNRVIAEELFNRSLEPGHEPIDYITLQDSLSSQGKLEEAGGTAYLNTLIDGVATTANARLYANLVQEKSQLRQLINVGNEIIAYASNGELNADEALEKAQESLFTMTRERYNDYRPFREALNDTIDKIEENYRNRGQAVGVPTGYRDLDEKITGLHPSNLIILGGRPAMGKTALALSIAQNIAVSSSQRVGIGIFSLEMSYIEICMRILCADSRIPQIKLRKNDLIESDWPRLTASAGKLMDAPIFIDDTPGLGLHDITSKARRMVDEGCGVFIIDYLQLMGSLGGNIPREQFLAGISRGLKQLARELEVPIIALTQLNRGSEARTDKRPMLSDIRESGSIEQDADIVLFVHRQYYYEPDNEEIENEAEIIIAKNRHGEPGIIKLFFEGQFTRFENYRQGGPE
jgi:replicative DNA helicase